MRTRGNEIIKLSCLLIVIGAFVGILTTQLFAFDQNELRDNQPLMISVVLSKQTIKPDEKIWLACMIHNLSQESLVLRPEIYPYPVGYVKILNPSQVEMEEYTLPPRYSPKLGRESFVEVGSNHQISITFEPKLEWKPLPTLLGDEKPARSGIGLFFDFSDASILLDEGDRYFLQCEFEQKEDERIDGRKRFGFQNVWVGKIVSEPVELKIQR